MRNRIGRAASPSVDFKLRSGSRLHTSALELAQPLAAFTEARKRICDTAAVGTTVRRDVSPSVSSLYVRALIHDKPFAHPETATNCTRYRMLSLSSPIDFKSVRVCNFSRGLGFSRAAAS